MDRFHNKWDRLHNNLDSSNNKLARLHNKLDRSQNHKFHQWHQEMIYLVIQVFNINMHISTQPTLVDISLQEHLFKCNKLHLCLQVQLLDKVLIKIQLEWILIYQLSVLLNRFLLILKHYNLLKPWMMHFKLINNSKWLYWINHHNKCLLVKHLINNKIHML